MTLSWHESGVPPARKPHNPGFGTILIERNPRAALGADVDIAFTPDGLSWTLSAPLDRISAEASGVPPERD